MTKGAKGRRVPGARTEGRALLRAIAGPALAVLLALSFGARKLHADEPYARDRNYHLEHARLSLRFDTEQRKIFGEVTHRVVALRESVTRLDFDSVGLAIGAVTIDGRPAKFATTPTKLLIPLDPPAHLGQACEITIRYEGQPRRGLYFILPDKDYPNRPKEIWTQGEAEDTRYYVPIYDYPNDRLTSETFITVPAAWQTVSNGRLESTADAGGGMKTWHWVESLPHSTYLISIVAGEFERAEETWQGKPVTYYVPRGRAERIAPTFSRTREMLDYFSNTVGVPFPWEKYAQVEVDEFVVGGMENSSAATLTASALLDPRIAGEYHEASDDLLAHEMAHQWFGDLVTCKDWGHLWLNEGFATAFEYFWEEKKYGGDEYAYTLWQKGRTWMTENKMYAVPIVTRKFTDTAEYTDNIYTKAGIVLTMLRDELGPADFYRGVQNYLERNRGQNVVTGDLQKAIEEATGRNVDRFFEQWIFSAGAPRFEISDSYDDAARQLTLRVRQAQTVEGSVPLFRVPVDVEITTTAGRKNYPILISQAEEDFRFVVPERPLMILFDRGNKILKSVEYKKGWQDWAYQLRHAEAVPDRADAAAALREFSDNPAVVAALGDAAQHDSFWGVRVEALHSLGRLGGTAARDCILAALDGQQPWTRRAAVSQLALFRDDRTVAARLERVFREDPAWLVRGAALDSLAILHAKNAYDLLRAAMQMDSPNDRMRATALNDFGVLGDERALPLVLAWSAPGQPLDARPAAIHALGRLAKDKKEITRRLIGYLAEPLLDVRQAAIFALGERGDPEAAAPIEALVRNGELYDTAQTEAENVIKELRGVQDSSQERSPGPPLPPGAAAAGGTNPEIRAVLERIEREVKELKDRVKKLEEKFGNRKD
jgi:aminopeptidase N